MPFISLDQFDALKAECDNILKWRDVPSGVIYKIEDVEEIKTKKGEATVVSLVDCDGDRFRAFATSILREDLKGRTGVLYIRPLGEKKVSTTNPGQSYYTYDLVEQQRNASDQLE